MRGEEVVITWLDPSELPSSPTDETWAILAYLPRREEHGRRPVCELHRFQEYEGGDWYWQTPPGITGRGYLVLPETIARWAHLPEAPALSTPPQKKTEGEL